MHLKQDLQSCSKLRLLARIRMKFGVAYETGKSALGATRLS